jgi:hypothetical protein
VQLQADTLQEGENTFHGRPDAGGCKRGAAAQEQDRQNPRASGAGTAGALIRSSGDPGRSILGFGNRTISRGRLLALRPRLTTGVLLSAPAR